MTLLKLFLEFFKIGLFSVGGGMATLPFLYDMSDKTGWFSYAQIADMLAVSESTPGPIGINMASYVGYTVGGIPGAIIATISIVIPGLVLVLIIAKFLERVRNNKYVEGAFYGLRPASTALIAAAGVTVVSIALLNIELYESTGAILDLFSWEAIVLAVIIWLLTNVVKPTKKIHPIIYIVVSAAIGIAFNFAGV